MDQTQPSIPAYAPLLVKLLQGVIYDEDRRVWQELLAFQHQVRQYFAAMGVELHLNEKEGFAYLSQPDELDGAPNPSPRLVRRMPLSYEVTLLLVVLREALEEFDLYNTDSRKLFINNRELKERIEVFFENKTDEVKLLERLDQYINQTVGLGFLREVEVRQRDEQVKTYEVRRIVKAKVDVEKLAEIKRKLKES